MGVYLYKSKPSHVAKARIKLPDGQEEVGEVALFQFAYKPYNWDQAANARMHFRSGAISCERAWDRSRREVPKYGFNIADEGPQAAPAQPFLTQGVPTSHDDWAKHDGAIILEWLELPKGLKEVVYDR